jgi:hypothetical protein
MQKSPFKQQSINIYTDNKMIKTSAILESFHNHPTVDINFSLLLSFD